ncbi:MAG: DinB family protein [Candidatus Krumholzibacteriia bacterium]
MQETPRLLREAVRGLPRAQLLWTPAPGAWSILEILCHMRDMERDAYLARYRALLGGRRPLFRNIDPDARAAEGDYRSQRVSEVMRDWQRLRRETLQLLRGIDAASWGLEGAHETDGPLDVQTLLEHQARGNDRVHLRQIERNKERHSVLTRLAAAPLEVEAVLRAVPEDCWRQRSGSARWSILEHLGHLSDFEYLMVERYSRMANFERPRLRSFDPDATAARRRYRDRDPRALVREFRRLRAATLELLHALGHQAWRRQGIHPARGEVRIEDMVAHHLDHDAKHVSRMRSLAEELHSPPPVRGSMEGAPR